MRRRRPPPSTLLSLISLLSTPLIVSAAETVVIAWTTDYQYQGSTGAYGPDGPWQAIVVSIGNSTLEPGSNTYTGDNFCPMYPSGAGTTQVLTTAATKGTTRGNYSYENSTSALVTQTRLGNSDDWMASAMMNDSSLGTGVLDVVNLHERPNTGTNLGDVQSEGTASIAAYDKWDVNGYEDGSRTYTMPVGVLGLGLSEPRWLMQNPQDDEKMTKQKKSILHGLRDSGRIASASFGLHMGSVSLGQRGSLVLGGYEQNRALGEVGVWGFDPYRFPLLYLVDVRLGTQVGGSPFDGDDDAAAAAEDTSIWQGVGDNKAAAEIGKTLGIKDGTAAVIPNPAAPYIYLPPAACGAAAKKLPVTFDVKLGLYLWDVASPAYERIVRSPAYMAFVLSDRSAANLTVKVPFALLNLTLEHPIPVDKPTAYFPCKPLDSQYGFWTLGRAFLQAAFLGLDFERNVTYLAQAPGPAMEQSVVVAAKPGSDGDGGLQTNPIEQFESSWLGQWTVLQGGAGTGGNGQVGTEVANNGSNGGGLSVGAIVGIVVGVVVAVLILAILVWMLFFKGRKSDDAGNGPVVRGHDDDQGNWATSSSGEKVELDTSTDAAELGAPNVHAHEFYAPETAQEASPAATIDYAELAGEVPGSLSPEGRQELGDDRIRRSG